MCKCFAKSRTAFLAKFLLKLVLCLHSNAGEGPIVVGLETNNNKSNSKGMSKQNPLLTCCFVVGDRFFFAAALRGWNGEFF